MKHQSLLIQVRRKKPDAPKILSLFVFDKVVVSESIRIGDALGIEVRHTTTGDAERSFATTYRFVESEETQRRMNAAFDRLFEQTLEQWNAKMYHSLGVKINSSHEEI